eukprot:UN04070
MQAELQQNDIIARQDDNIQQFKRELFKYIDTYRDPKNVTINGKRLRGSDELIIFAQETYRVISQLQNPFVQDLLKKE